MLLQYVWGSTTKMFTASAVLQLIEAGRIALNDTVAKHVDPYLKGAKNTTMEAKFGTAIHTVLIHHLLHMTSGIADYDGEKYATDQFKDRERDFGLCPQPHRTVTHCYPQPIVARTAHSNPTARLCAL